MTTRAEGLSAGRDLSGENNHTMHICTCSTRLPKDHASRDEATRIPCSTVASGLLETELLKDETHNTALSVTVVTCETDRIGRKLEVDDQNRGQALLRG